jgi:hypothetical protein
LRRASPRRPRIRHSPAFPLDLIRPSIWTTLPTCSHRRTIATSFAHIHNVRCMRLKASGYGPGIPARLDRATVTLAQAREALGQSAAAMVQLIERSLAAGGHVADFRPDVVALVCDAATNGSAGPTPTGPARPRQA